MTLAIVAVLLSALVVALLGGSYLYWNGEGQPGTPADFQNAVGEAGLTVEWANAGPKAGSGEVATECGEITVDVDLIDDELWVRWNGERSRLDDATIDQILGCMP